MRRLLVSALLGAAASASALLRDKGIALEPPAEWEPPAGWILESVAENER